MLCEKCQKNSATVHVQQYINGTKAELYLCQECSFKSEMPISFENIFQGFLESIHSIKPQASHPKNRPTNPCSVCEMTYEQFKQSGKLGCEACYQAFHKEIESLFKTIHGSTKHEGKLPNRAGVLLRQKREVDRLRADLKNAVDEENFEEAARIRDEIRLLEVNK